MTLPSKNPILHAPSLIAAWIPVLYSSGAFLWMRAIEKARLSASSPEMVRELNGRVCVLLIGGLVLVLLAFVQQRAELGAEAISLRWFGWRRSYAYPKIRRATPNGYKKVTIELMGGMKLELSANFLDDAAARDVLDRFWRALAAGAQEGSRGVEREMLARSGRSTAEWRQALHDLGGPGSYRQAQLSKDRLLAIAENPGITTEIRTAAVIALCAVRELDENARNRLREAGMVTVEPHLRALLEAISQPHATLGPHACDLALDAVFKS